MADISKNIKKFRREAEMTQQQLAEKLNVTRQAVSNWENRKTQPDIEMLQTIARELQITIEELIYGEKISREETARDKKPLIKKAVILAAATAAIGIFAFQYQLWASAIASTQYIVRWAFMASYLVWPIFYILIGVTGFSVLSIFFDIHVRAKRKRIICGICFVGLVMIWPYLGTRYWLSVNEQWMWLWYPLVELCFKCPYIYIFHGILLYFATAKR